MTSVTLLKLVQLQQEIQEHVEEPGEGEATGMETESPEGLRKRQTASSEGEDPVSWKPTGDADTLRWKKHKSNDTGATYLIPGKRILTAKIKKKMLDKEIPYKELPEKDLPLYHKAEEKEWDDWLNRKSVNIIKSPETKQICVGVLHKSRRRRNKQEAMGWIS